MPGIASSAEPSATSTPGQRFEPLGVGRATRRDRVYRHAGGSRRDSAAAHQATMSFASECARLGVRHVRPAAHQGFQRSASVALMLRGRKGRHVGGGEQGYVPRADSEPAIAIRALGLSRLARSNPTVS